MKYIKGPTYPVKVRFVTNQTLRRRAQSPKGEEIKGLYDPAINTIFIRVDLPAEESLMVLLHEVSHAVDYQLGGLDEEQRADHMAIWLRDFAGFSSVEEVFE